MDIVEAKTRLPEPSTYTKCTCYYDEYELIRGCTRHDNILHINNLYENQLATAKNAKK
jgi:hypothetical protein